MVYVPLIIIVVPNLGSHSLIEELTHFSDLLKVPIKLHIIRNQGNHEYLY